MKDAFGGILNLVFIGIFLLIVEGVLALIVNYTKAFKMKNIVISAFEKYEAAAQCKTGPCYDKIVEEAKRIGYSPMADPHCSKNFTNVGGYFCYLPVASSSGNHWYYSVETQVDLNFPLLNKILAMPFFKVRGDTRIITTSRR